MQTNELLQKIVQTLEDKKANNICVLDVGELTSLGDYFVVADADNNTHVKSLVDEVEDAVKQAGRVPKRLEKDRSANWIVLDYADVIVHIFHKQAREFYDLERLWADAKVVSVEEILSGKDVGN